MFVVKIDGVDASCHTEEVDATTQKTLFEALGRPNVTIVETDTFNPPDGEN